MKPLRKLTIISFAILLAIPAICSAAPYASPYAAPYARPYVGPYVSGFLGVSVPRDSSATTDQYFQPQGTFNDQIEFDPGIYMGATGGYDFGIVRLEGELSYRYSEIKSIVDQSNNSSFSNPDGNLGVFTFMANAFFDLHNNSPVTPYLGGGIGFASLYLSDTYGNHVHLYDDGDDTVFAYQVGGGADIAINRKLSLDIGYRYFGTDTANFNRNSNRETRLKFESHNASVGVRVRF